MFRRLVFSAALSLSFAGSAPAQEFSTFTQELVKLFDMFGKLDAAAAAQMAANDRHILAKKMMRLSEEFRQLSVAKSRYENEIKQGFATGKDKTLEMKKSAEELVRKVQNVSVCLEKTVAVLLAQSEFNGNEVEKNLREGLDEKYSTLIDQMERLGFEGAPSSLDTKILADSTKARETAEKLQESAITFAKRLDPNVLPQSNASVCRDDN